MEPNYSWTWLSFSLLFAAISLLFFSSNLFRKATRLPPGPPPMPIVGNIFQLGKNPHESLFHLAKKYGPLMTLNLGFKKAVVVSSAGMAKEVLKNHDAVLSARTVIEGAKCLSYADHSMVWMDCVPRWSTLRRICATELFSPKRLDALQHLRKGQVTDMIRSVYTDSVKGNSVDIGHAAFLTSINLLGNMIFSQTMFERGSQGSHELKDNLAHMMVVAGTPNLADYFPFLRFLDPQGIRRELTRCFGIVFELFDKYIEERLQSSGNEEREKDFLDILLESKKDTGENFTKYDITRFFYDLFTAGTETTSTTIEWTMAELFCNPHIMQKVKEELDKVVGNERRVEEEDIEQLYYLHAVVKEVMRLYPPAPLLIPHKAKSSCEITRYIIPKDAQVLVNAWAIGRDPLIWNVPEKFSPNRFLQLNEEVEYKGRNFELIPFGSGRRICPGLSLAHIMVHIGVASLVQCFDWCLPYGHSMEKLDMSGTFGITLHKSQHLVVVPTPRLPLHLYE